MIWPFPSLIVKTSVGKLMYASSRSTTLTMGLTVMPRSSLKLTPRRPTTTRISPKPKRMTRPRRSKRKRQSQSSETILLNSRKLSRRSKPGERSTRTLMIFQIASFQSHMISPTLMASISLDQSVTKELVDLAILFLSLKLLSQDLRLNMAKMYQCCPLNIS